ncbi:hypothetical protein Tco_0649598 [Tanacetum coccineum]
MPLVSSLVARKKTHVNLLLMNKLPFILTVMTHQSRRMYLGFPMDDYIDTTGGLDSGCHGRCGDDGVGDGDEGGVPTVEMVTGETVMMTLAVGGDDNEDDEGGDGSGDRSMVEKVLHPGDDEGGSKGWQPV